MLQFMITSITHKNVTRPWTIFYEIQKEVIILWLKSYVTEIEMDIDVRVKNNIKIHIKNNFCENGLCDSKWK